MHKVSVGQQIRILVEDAYGTTEKKGTVLTVSRLDTTSYSGAGMFYAKSSDNHTEWYFVSSCFEDGLIELVQELPKVSPFNIKRIKALKRSAQERGWVQLGLGDVAMFQEVIDALEK